MFAAGTVIFRRRCRPSSVSTSRSCRVNPRSESSQSPENPIKC
ncbi:Uncharacterised protein [Vibrio cholerae]|nr:Uncharacterised protein [Vibrio cholerae]